ncbi:MAG: reverse transcriptase domain-containing protein, partial [bacterium]
EKLNEAIANEREAEAVRVKAILRGEAQRKCWQGIKRATKAKEVMSVTRVEVVQDDGSVVEHTAKESIEEALKTELRTRFGRATSAPICQGALFELLGNFADTSAAVEILEGTFVPPPDTDPRTLLLFDEMASIWSRMGNGEISISVSQEDFQYYWRRVKERTSSSLSGIHFGHYKSMAHDDNLSQLMARKLSLTTTTGASPDRWARGLSVMLEKIAGVAVVNKLRAILLLEADFNFCNKLIFGHRMINSAREEGMIPEEIFSSKGKTAEDAILQQVLLYDIARVTKRPLLVAQVDAAQCYDRVALPAASLTLQAFNVPQSAVMSMLRPLHNMEFFLRTGYGQSESYFGGKEDGKHGLAQGNGAAPATWQQTSTTIVNAQRRSGHGITIECPITRKSVRQVGILYVDDTNLWAGLDEDDDLFSTAAKGQASISDWGGLLGATGGALKGEKCGVTIHHQSADGKGGWVYTDQQQRRQGETDGAEMEDNDLSSLAFHVPTT